MTDETGKGKALPAQEDINQAAFVAMSIAYAELVKELVAAGVIDKGAIAGRLGAAAELMRELGQDIGAALMEQVRYGVTPR